MPMPASHAEPAETTPTPAVPGRFFFAFTPDPSHMNLLVNGLPALDETIRSDP
jgi:hypothetical protein